jgi:ParB family protein of integrating conjugative element (PFGI_1 class)
MSVSKKELTERMAAQMAKLRQQASPEALAAVPKSVLENEKRLIRLNVNDIDPYGKNPRTEVNPEYEAIKESIRAKGLETILTVTKRPGDAKYTLSKGGKTRLTIIKELAAEPGGDKWQYQECLFEPFTGETALLSSHLIENMQRGAMSFWDTAKGIMAMRETMEQERSKAIGREELQTEFAQIGVSLDANFPNEADFAVRNYSALEAMAHALTRDNVRRSLRPQYNSILALWLKHPGYTEDTFDAHYKEFIALYQAAHDAFDLTVLMELIASEFADLMQMTPARLDKLCQLIGRKEHRETPLEQLLELVAEPAASTGEDFQLEGYGDTAGEASVGGEGTQVPAPAVTTRTPGEQLLHDKLSGKVPRSANAQDEKPLEPGNCGIPGVTIAFGLTPKPKQETKLPASKRFVALIEDLIVKSGLGHLILPLDKETPDYPLAMILDLPQHPLHDVRAVEVWWLVAAFTGQVSPDARSVANFDLLPDCHFKRMFQDVHTNGERITELFGQLWRDDSAFILEVTCNPLHPLYDVAFELLSIWREYRATQGGGQ